MRKKGTVNQLSSQHVGAVVTTMRFAGKGNQQKRNGE